MVSSVSIAFVLTMLRTTHASQKPALDGLLGVRPVGNQLLCDSDGEEILCIQSHSEDNDNKELISK